MLLCHGLMSSLSPAFSFYNKHVFRHEPLYHVTHASNTQIGGLSHGSGDDLHVSTFFARKLLGSGGIIQPHFPTLVQTMDRRKLYIVAVFLHHHSVQQLYQ